MASRAARRRRVTRWGHTLCDLDALLKRHPGGKPTTTYGAFLGHLEKEMKAVPIAPIEAPVSLPPLGEFAPIGDSGRAVGGGARHPEPVGGGHPQGRRDGGARADGLAHRAHRLDRRLREAEHEPDQPRPLWRRTRARRRRCRRTSSSAACRRARSTARSVWCTPRRGASTSKPPTSLHGQLFWREFYYACAHGTPNYHRMEGNPICRQVPWDDDDALLAAWKEGRTGYPWIDAAMTQLREEGWIHHLARHAVACFLTRGDLWQSWEKGAEVFDELLLDADPAINAGNWMWLSCSCFFYQYFRCYSPVAFPKKYDPDGSYVKRWLPQLKGYPAKYIYEPWKAPIADQKKAGCVIGVDYPKPIVEHTERARPTWTR